VNPTIAQSLPIISLVVVGCLLRKFGVIQPGDGTAMTRFILNITLPAVIFLSVSRANVAPLQLGFLALCGVIVALGVRVVAGILTKWLKLEPEIAGVIIVGSMVMNVGAFLFPLIQTLYGSEGVSRLAAFDLGNSLVASGYGYYLATCFGNKTVCGIRNSLRKALSVPILWASLLGILVNLSGAELPTFLLKILEPVGLANTPLAMIALGTFLQFNFPKWKLMVLTVFLRMGGGFLFGQTLIYLANLQGFERAAVGMGAAAPVGMVTLVYSVSEGLDAEFAAAVISLSILVGLISAPLMLLLY
jgi:malate permease and related proteins